MTSKLLVVNPENGNFLTPRDGWTSDLRFAWQQANDTDPRVFDEARELAERFGGVMVQLTEGSHDRVVVAVDPATGDTLMVPTARRARRYGSAAFGEVEFNWPGAGSRATVANVNEFVRQLTAVRFASRIL